MRLAPNSGKIFFGIDTVKKIGDDPDVTAFGRRAVRGGIEEGAFPAGAPGPVGTEDAAVAYDSAGSVIGIAVYYLPDGYDYFWLNMLWVAPEHRRQTVGSRLVAAVIAAAAREAKPLHLAVLVANTDAARLYESLGFVPESINYRKDIVK